MATVRVDKKLHDTLRELAKSEHRPIGEVIEDAIAKYEKDKFWKEMHEGFARLRADPVAWKEYQEDAAVWDAMSNDDFADEEPYFTEDEARHEANATTPFG
ncbi:MAG TPA: ribbon-helix-helix domain-containing protein [Thermomicrobiales bacterium]|nr:ribbon-helix-helix domain-containing protein [Thermomicrobiales bacterium]